MAKNVLDLVLSSVWHTPATRTRRIPCTPTCFRDGQIAYFAVLRLLRDVDTFTFVLLLIDLWLPSRDGDPGAQVLYFYLGYPLAYGRGADENSLIGSTDVDNDMTNMLFQFSFAATASTPLRQPAKKGKK